jgi:ubiquinone/menaquinone biosynthesis C-methylase UbiE
LSEAENELKKRDITVDLVRCGFENLETCFKENFDLVIAIDNAIPHLLTDERILNAFRSMYRICKKGILVSIRDFDMMDESRIQLVPYGYRQIKGKRMFLFQRWEFEGDLNSVSFFFMEENTQDSTRVEGNVFNTKYYAIKTDKLMELMQKAGFVQTRCIKNDFSQPVIVGKK